VQLIEKLQFLQRKIYKKTNQSFLEKGYETQKKKLESLGEPKNLLERSYFQYLCQMYNVPFLIKMTQNLLAIPLIVYYLMKKYKSKGIFSDKNSKTAVFLREGITKDFLPDSLSYEFADIIEIPLNGNIYLSNHDKKIIFKKLFKYIKSPFFVLKCLMKMGVYSNVIHIYKPPAIITHIEYSFTSSFLTLYCQEMMVEHINIMHGEKLYNVRDSFFEFNRFYVWDTHYIELFIQLKAPIKQFVVEKPNHLQLNLSLKTEYEFKLTYYLGGEDEQSLNDLVENLSKLSIPKNEICIRYHPRYSNKKQIQNIFYGFIIQDPKNISIKKSLEMTEYVASLYSTVLYEALYNGKKIMLDDLTNVSKYEKLKSLGYIIFSKEHNLLSELLDC
jgi:hypothetical protein